MLKEEQKQLLASANLTHTPGGWLHLQIEGSAFQRGFQHGYLLADALDHCLRSNRYWAYWMTAQPFDLFVQVADELYMQTNLIEPEYVEEMHGIAQGASANGCETTFGEILAWNCFVDIIYSGWSTLAADYVKPQGNHSQFQWLRPKPHRYTGHRCSAFIATGDATQSGEIVMAHTTWDAFIQAQHFNVIVYIQPEHGESLLCLLYTSPSPRDKRQSRMPSSA